MRGYAFENGWYQARERLAAMEALYDPVTCRHLDALGVAPGWSCLEVGAGGGSIATWLGARVGPFGAVLATDIDPRFLDALAAPNVQVQRHDITLEDLPAGQFDLVHCRHLLAHLLEPDRALGRLVAALKPGGWLLVEESDFASRVADLPMDDASLMERCWDAWEQHIRSRGMDPTYGRRLYRAVSAQCLCALGSSGSVWVVQGGTPEARVQRLSFAQLRDGLLATERVTEGELERFLALQDDPEAIWLGPALISVWGRKPGA